jgi:pyruvate/2-oxoglutarate dehydrogenase complex dihydrolipoamide acyltransferase (E2) component
MPRIPIIMPQLGESIAEATVVRFNVKVGDHVEVDQEVIEVETNKAVMGVVTPCPGIIADFSVRADQTCPVGAVLGYVEATEDDARKFGLSVEPASSTEGTKTSPAEPLIASTQPEARHGLPVPVAQLGASFFSPRLRARMDELGIQSTELGVIPGTGKGARVTIEDLESYLESLAELPARKASALRLAVADSMRRSWTRPLATAAIAVCLEGISVHRKSLVPPPGPALYAAKALAIAISENPQYAGRLIGQKLVLPGSIDIGVAVEVEDGVIVPVIRELDQKSLAQLTSDYQKLLEIARSRRLPENARNSGIASVTNYGPLGITWATPIPLPTESLIVGLGRGEKRPVWDELNSRFIPKLQAELTITFDHRVLDGGAAGRLLQRLKALLERPEDL